MEKLEELASLKNQVEDLRLQDRLGKQNFHNGLTETFEPVTKSNKDISEDVTKKIAEISIENNIALANLNEKLLEKLKDRGLVASYLLSPLSENINLEQTSHSKLVKDLCSNRVIDLLINKTIPVIFLTTC